MVKLYFLALAFLLIASGSPAQTTRFQRCGAQQVLEEQLRQDPGMAQQRLELEEFTRKYQKANSANSRINAVITIPVVVHVVYNTASQNISNCQIESQIAALNEDFRKLNADNANTPAIYAGVAADVQLEFVLAKRDPNGNPTPGITRTLTQTTTFSTNNAIKYTNLGGHDAWDTRNYLNFWIAPALLNQGQQLLGYGQFPGGPRATDGVVMAYAAFGSRAKCPTGVYYQGYDLGRTTTHEVGHYLNLKHIWGDANCGNDLVSDTPTQLTFNFGCPAFPQVTCGNQGDMSMNFMDYTDDACMYMFTAGQATRMNATLAPGAYHNELTTSLGGIAPGTLPVELAGFTGKPVGPEVALTWETASEKDNAFFYVEHAAHGRDFEAVGTIKGHGTSNQIKHYRFTHQNPAIGKNYYRLKQVDRSGSYAYSKVIVLEFKGTGSLATTFYPNPVNADLGLTYTVTAGQPDIQIRIYDQTGKLVATYNEGPKLPGNHSFKVSARNDPNFAGLKNGLYFCRITGAGTEPAIRFVIER